MDTTLMRQAKQATERQLFIAFELAQRHWRLAFGDGVGRPRLVTLEAGDQVAVKEAIAKARIHFGLDEAAAVVSCYEAGRDGFWLHRWLLECGVENLIVDSGSIEVNRRQRRAKTERLDALKLLSMLMRYVGGERRVWTVLHVPTAEQEDGRRPHRERERLDRERLAHSNRIRGLLVLHNIRVKTIGGAKWGQRLQALRAHVPAQLWAEIGRESERLRLVLEQMRALEAERAQSLAQAEPTDPTREKTMKLVKAGEHRADERLGAGAGSVLANVAQPARGCPLRQTGADALRERGVGARARHQQGRQPSGARADGAACLVLAALPAPQRACAVVQRALRRGRQSHSAYRHCRTGTTATDR